LERAGRQQPVKGAVVLGHAAVAAAAAPGAATHHSFSSPVT